MAECSRMFDLIKHRAFTMSGNMTLQLSDTVQMPMVGFGTYLISDEDAETCVSNAIEVGYRHIDTAEGYRNERGVGVAIDNALTDRHLAREELFVTTKLWPGNPAWGMDVKNYQAILESCEASLERLRLGFVDLYLIHAPFSGPGRLEQWRALVELKRLGKVRAIGVSNYREQHIEEIRRAGLPMPQMNQIELHPWSQKPELVSYLAENGIPVTAYSSLIPLSTWRIEAGQDSAKTEAMLADGEKVDSPFRRMAMKYGVSEAQVLLRWAIQNRYAVLPKSASKERARQNLDLFEFAIDDDDMAEISSMDKGQSVAWAQGDPTLAV